MINENKIREACASNRERGFKMLMNSFQVPIYNYIRRLVVSHEDAEDIIQEVFLKLWENEDCIEITYIKTYLFRAAKNRVLNYLRDEENRHQLLENWFNQQLEERK